MVIKIKSVNLKLGQAVLPKIDVFKPIDKLDLTGSVIDPRLGPIDTIETCATCGKTYKFCPGHKGLLTLNHPIIVAKKPRFITKLLSLFTSSIDEKGFLQLGYNIEDIKNIENDNPVERMKIIKTLPKIETYDYKTGEKGAMLDFKVTPKKKKHEAKFILDNGEMVDLRDIKALLKLISNESLSLITKQPVESVSRPENAILEHLIIPSNNVRMNIAFNKSSEQHFFTSILDLIVINNNKLLTCSNVKKIIVVSEIIELVNRLIYNLSEENFSIEKELKSKEGVINRFYGNRGKYSARMTITPSPYLRLNQVSIPSIIANNITTQDWLIPFITKVRMPELINITPDQYDKKSVERFRYENRRFFKVFNQFFVKGSRGWLIKKVGVKSVYNIESISYSTYMKEDEHYFMVVIKYDGKTIELKAGTPYRRYLCDGDWVQVSRQPVLHKYGFQGFFIKIHDDSDTMRINVSICKMFGADFDGDTMNLYSPSSIESKLETMVILNVEKNMINDSSGAINAGITQNTLLSIGVFFESTFDQDEIESILETVGLTLDEHRDVYDGRFIFNQVLPNINCENVIDGEYVGPTLDKKSLNVLLKNIHNCKTLVDPGKTMVDINWKLQQMFNKVLTIKGYSAGYTASFITDDTKKALSDLVEDAKLINESKGDSLQDEYLKTLKLNTFTSKVIKYIKNDANVKNDSYIKMVNIGVKGTDMNVAHAFGMIGQQMYEGLRPKFDLPITGNDLSSHGFIVNSYFKGMSLVEIFISSICARPGLASNATLTADTGYLQKKFVSVLTDLITHKDHSIRTINGNIISFNSNINIETKNIKTDVKRKIDRAYVYYTDDNEIDYDCIPDDLPTWIVYNPSLPIKKHRIFNYLPNINKVDFPFESIEI